MSSNSGTAFVPISAVPGGTGGLPPGTTLYGAYGQPLRDVPTASQSQSQPQPQRHFGAGADFTPSIHSPTSQYPPYDDRDANRRRTRPTDEEHPSRPPPPNYPVDEDPRRRSPTSNHSNGTPPTIYHQYQPGYEQERMPTPHRNSPSNGSAMPPIASPAQSHPTSSSTSNPMSLSSMVANDPRDRGSAASNGSSSNSNIDKDMLGRLNPGRGR